MKYLLLLLLLISCSEKEQCYNKNTFYGLDNYTDRAGFPQYNASEIICTDKSPVDFELYVDFVLYEVDSIKNTVVLGKKVKRKLITIYTKL